MVDPRTYRRLQVDISSARTMEDIEEIRKKIAAIPEDDPEREGLAEQLAIVKSGLEMEERDT